MDTPRIITLTLNPCIDKTVQVCAFTPGKTNRVLSSREDVGGKGLNVSRVLRGSGVPVLTAALAADDVRGRLQTEFCCPGGQTLFQRCGEKTRVNLKIIDTQTRAMTEVNEPGYPAGDAVSSLLTALDGFLPHAKALVLSGSLPPDCGADVYQKLIGRAGALGVKTVLDADGEAMRLGVQRAPFAVKPNLEELSRWAGRPLTDRRQIFAAMRALHDNGVRLICVSMGADGAYFSMDGLVLHAKPFPIRAGSPAAAGDAMTAMLAWSLVQDIPALQTAQLSACAGTCTAEKDGTQTAPFSEIQTRYPDIIITKEEML